MSIEVEGKPRSRASVVRALQALDPQARVRVDVSGERLTIDSVLSAQEILNALEELDMELPGFAVHGEGPDD